MTVVADRPASPDLEAAVAGLRHALDLDDMRRRLERLLWPDGGGALELVAAGKLLLRPDGACSLRYTAAVRMSDGRARDVSVGARVPARADAAEALRRDLTGIARAAAGHPLLRGLAAPVATDAAVPIAVHVFPIEPELPGLAAATDPARAGELLGAALGRADVGPCRVEIAHHPREGRCTLRYRAADGEAVYAKVAHGLSPEPARIMRAVHANARGLRVPQPLGAVPDLGLSLQSEVAGRPCAAALVQPAWPGQRAKALALCARAAARLHACPVTTGRVRSALADAAALQRELGIVRALDTGLADDLGGCIERALVASGPAPSGPARLCHGDLTHRQIVLEGGVPGLLDFDDVCMSEPGLDVGHFCAYLRLAARRAAQRGRADDGEAMCRRFVYAYLEEAGGRALDRRRLARRAAVYESLALVHVAISSWRQGKPARMACARSLLEEGGVWPRP
jgi:aminoglycoside phosphotransferase (APT) family kinase protein